MALPAIWNLFSRIRVGGKLIRKTLKTTVFSVAQLKLADFAKERRAVAETQSSGNGKMLVGDALAIYKKELDHNTRLKPGAKLYRQKTIDALLKSCPGLSNREIKTVSQAECLEWAKAFHSKYSISVFNNTVGTLRHVLAIGIREGVRYNNPASAIKKAKVKPKHLVLPEQSAFLKLVEQIENGGGRFSQGCSDLVRFLAFGGFRKSEAAGITWGDCDFAKSEIMVRVMV